MPVQIVAIGGGGFSDADGLSPVDRYLLELAGRERPRVCFLPTASGDSERYVARFYRAFAHVADASDLALFGAPSPAEVESVAEVDLVYVGGGNTANLLALWRLHGLDEVLRAAGERGTILAGMSAGAICWFEASLTDSFGLELAPLADGLGLIHGSACPHFDGEPTRRHRFAEEIAAGRLPAGVGIDDGVALHFVDQELAGVVTEVPDRAAYWLELRDGEVHESRMEATLLPGSTGD